MLAVTKKKIKIWGHQFTLSGKFPKDPLVIMALVRNVSQNSWIKCWSRSILHFISNTIAFVILKVLRIT